MDTEIKIMYVCIKPGFHMSGKSKMIGDFAVSQPSQNISFCFCFAIKKMSSFSSFFFCHFLVQFLGFSSVVNFQISIQVILTSITSKNVVPLTTERQKKEK